MVCVKAVTSWNERKKKIEGGSQCCSHEAQSHTALLSCLEGYLSLLAISWGIVFCKVGFTLRKDGKKLRNSFNLCLTKFLLGCFLFTYVSIFCYFSSQNCIFFGYDLACHLLHTFYLWSFHNYLYLQCIFSLNFSMHSSVVSLKFHLFCLVYKHIGVILIATLSSGFTLSTPRSMSEVGLLISWKGNYMLSGSFVSISGSSHKYIWSSLLVLWSWREDSKLCNWGLE